MNLTLHYYPIACSLVPYITLTEAGADFKVETVNLRTQQHKGPEFTQLTRKQKVPVLVIDGEPLTENVAIQIWIARRFPQAKLLPTDGLNEYKAIALMAWCASGIHPFLTPNFLPQRYCDVPGTEDAVRRCAQKVLVEQYQIADDLLKDREFFFDHFTATDAYFFWCFRRGIQFKVDVSMFTHCMAHYERMLQRASVQKLLAFEAATLAADAKP